MYINISLKEAVKNYLRAQEIGTGFLGLTVGNHFSKLKMSYGTSEVLREIAKQRMNKR